MVTAGLTCDSSGSKKQAYNITRYVITLTLPLTLTEHHSHFTDTEKSHVNASRVHNP